jgi:hypothetical protein
MNYLTSVCPPATLYFVLSMITIAVIAFQSYFSGTNVYCVGENTCVVSNIYMLYAIKILYVLFWTWLLNVMCKGGATFFAWILVLIPYILFIILIVLYVLSH